MKRDYTVALIATTMIASTSIFWLGIRRETTITTALTTRMKSLWRDPVLIGSIYVLLLKQQTSTWKHFLSDAFLLGMLWTWRNANSSNDTNDGCDKARQHTLSPRQVKRSNREMTDASAATTSHLPVLLPKKEVQQHSENSDNRHLEMMVHNVSHTDLVLSLEAPDAGEEYCLCRPRFSAFSSYSRRIWQSMTGAPLSLISFPQYERTDTSYQIQSEPTTMEKLSLGFSLKTEITSQELKKDLRLRGKDAPRFTDAHQDKICINAIFFPLLAAALSRWHANIQFKYPNVNSENSATKKKVLILVSGVGTPRNWTHSIGGNSTEYCAKLMAKFVQSVYPDLIVVPIHSSTTNIFRYEDNISFVQNELMPCINSYRDAHAKGLPYPDETNLKTNNTLESPFLTDWRRTFTVALSVADGSHARHHAIQAALRPYRPNYFHFWQLKTFWHESKVVNSDIDFLSFDDMETTPPIETSQFLSQKYHNDESSAILQLVVEEMRSFRNEMLSILEDDSSDNDIRTFWLRKTQKPVLAVLAVRTAGGNIQLYRGTNMEVSMPTGSLCAERNVIGTALADNPTLHRFDLKYIAVLSIPSSSTNIRPMSRAVSTTSLAASNYSPEDDVKQVDINWADESAHSQDLGHRIIPLFDHNSKTSPTKPPKQKRAIVTHHEDMNPLRPCGACHEWLKKIAESNPYFQIVTFTDVDCHGVYCQFCSE